MTGSKRLLLSPPHMSGAELPLVVEAIESGFVVPLGPMLDAFEAEFSAYTGFPHCVAVSSGTAAMHLALRHLGVGSGDGVLASTFTFIASVAPAAQLGATVSFIDSETASWNMDPGILAVVLASRAEAGRLPKAVIPTDLYGQPCDLHGILSACEPYGVPVVCDSAEAVGAWYTSPSGERLHAGRGARAAVFSFNGNKIITTSGGGMLSTEDADLAAHARKLATQAREPAPHYEHTELGYNYRMSNIIAAIGRGQLSVLDQRVEKRRAIFEQYQRLLGDLPGLRFMPEAPWARHTRWLTVALVDAAVFGTDRTALCKALADANIEARPAWKPMHLQPVFRGSEIHGGGVAEAAFQQGICLPSGSDMTDQDVERVAGVLRACAPASQR